MNGISLNTSIGINRLFNCIEEKKVTPRSIRCDNRIEKGNINIKVRKGFFRIPRKISFELPNYNTRLWTDENPAILEERHMIKKTPTKLNIESKGVFAKIDCTKLPSFHNIHNLEIPYTRPVSKEYINQFIEFFETNSTDSKKIDIANFRDIQLLNYKIKSRVSLDYKVFKRYQNEITTDGRYVFS